MGNGFRESVLKVVTYVNTPLAAIALLAVVVLSAMLWAPANEIVMYVLVGLLALIVIVFLYLLVRDPKRLQLTGKELFVRELIQLGDSDMGRLYLLGDDIPKTTVEQIPLKEDGQG